MPIARMRPFSLVVPVFGFGRPVQSPPAIHWKRVGQFVTLIGVEKDVLKVSGSASRRTTITGLAIALVRRISHPVTGFPPTVAGTSILKKSQTPGGVLVRTSARLSVNGFGLISSAIRVNLPSGVVG